MPEREETENKTEKNIQSIMAKNFQLMELAVRIEGGIRKCKKLSHL